MTRRNSTTKRALDSARGRSRARAGWAVLAGTALAGMAISNQRLAREAERDHPPRGSFVDVDGVRLHYVDRGHGEPVVLIHGNGSSVDDLVALRRNYDSLAGWG